MKRVLSVAVLLVFAGCTSVVSGDTLSGQGEADIGTLNATELEHEIHRQVNQEREARGLNTLSYNPDLRQVARYHSEDMANTSYFRHTAPDGESIPDRYEQFNIECPGENIAGENIGRGYANARVNYQGETLEIGTNETRIASLLVQAWMNSKDHRKNLLDPEWENEGIGLATIQQDSRTKIYVTQNFC